MWVAVSEGSFWVSVGYFGCVGVVGVYETFWVGGGKWGVGGTLFWVVGGGWEIILWVGVGGGELGNDSFNHLPFFYIIRYQIRYKT